MAKILPGPMGVEPRGQMGGVVFSRNRYGMYVRNNSSPVNPDTPRQQAIRGFFTQMTQHWRDTLTAAQRAAWEDYAAETPFIDQYGLKQHSSGANKYIAFNTPWVDRGQARVDDAPTTPGQGPLLSATLTGDTVAGIQLTAYAPTILAADRILILRCAAVVSQSRNFYNGPFTMWGAQAGDVALPVLLVQPAQCAVGQRWFFRFRALISDGRISSPSTALVDITA